MNLKDFLKGCDRERIRISCKAGSNFVYIGNREELDLQVLNVEAVQRLIDRTNTRKDIDLSTFAKRISEFKSFEDREVLDTWNGDFEPDMLVIEIEGSDGWIPYLPELKPLTAETMNDKGAENLVVKLHKYDCDDLVTFYRAYENEDNEKIKSSYLSSIKALEKSIRKNRFGFFTDPDAVIKMCKKKAGVV